MADDEEIPEIKINDRRRFNQDGEARSDATPAEPKQQEEQPRPAPESPPQSAQTQAADAGTFPPVDFSSFVVSLATQALVLLGEVPDPMSGQSSVNIEAARQTIDILQMMEEKTSGNLTPDEHKLLTEVLASVRLAYVNKQKRTG